MDISQSGLVEAWTAYLYYKSFNKSMSSNFFESFAKSVQDMPKITAGMQFTVDWFIGMTQKFLNFVKTQFDIDVPILKNSHFPQVDAFGEEVQSFIEKFRQGAEYNYDNAQYLFELEKKG